MPTLRVHVVIFLSLTFVAGIVYWWTADWWAYYKPIGEDGKPKFQMPAWWQIIESTFVGSLASAAITLSIVAVDKIIRRVRRRYTPTQFMPAAQ